MQCKRKVLIGISFENLLTSGNKVNVKNNSYLFG